MTRQTPRLFGKHNIENIENACPHWKWRNKNKVSALGFQLETSRKTCNLYKSGVLRILRCENTWEATARLPHAAKSCNERLEMIHTQGMLPTAMAKVGSRGNDRKAYQKGAPILRLQMTDKTNEIKLVILRAIWQTQKECPQVLMLQSRWYFEPC